MPIMSHNLDVVYEYHICAHLFEGTGQEEFDIIISYNDAECHGEEQDGCPPHSTSFPQRDVPSTLISFN